MVTTLQSFNVALVSEFLKFEQGNVNGQACPVKNVYLSRKFNKQCFVWITYEIS